MAEIVKWLLSDVATWLQRGSGIATVPQKILERTHCGQPENATYPVSRPIEAVPGSCARTALQPTPPMRTSGVQFRQGVFRSSLVKSPEFTTAGLRSLTALWTNERTCPVCTVTTNSEEANHKPEPDSITPRRPTQIFHSIASPPPSQRIHVAASELSTRSGEWRLSGVARHGFHVADKRANWRTWAVSWCRTLPPSVPSARTAESHAALLLGFAAVEDHFSHPTSRQRLAVGRRSFFWTRWASCGPHRPRRCV